MRPQSRGIADGAVLLLGGRSQIGLATVERIARGRVVILASRRSDDLADETARIAAAGALDVRVVEFDASDTAAHPAWLEQIIADHGPLGVAILAFGILGDQDRGEQEAAHALEVVHTDYLAQVSLLTGLANGLRAQGAGHIVVFSSIAGVRVRRANYVYGSAKAGLDGFASGLADALYGTGVHLLLIRPGFVIGRMTEGMTPVRFVSSTPDQVAEAVVRGLDTQAGEVWIPPGLRMVAFAMRLVPRNMWRRMPR